MWRKQVQAWAALSRRREKQHARRQRPADGCATDADLDKVQGLNDQAAGEARQHMLHALQKVLNTVRQMGADTALQLAAADAVILPNLEADMDDRRIARIPDRGWEEAAAAASAASSANAAHSRRGTALPSACRKGQDSTLG